MIKINFDLEVGCESAVVLFALEELEATMTFGGQQGTMYAAVAQRLRKTLEAKVKEIGTKDNPGWVGQRGGMT